MFSHYLAVLEAEDGGEVGPDTLLHLPRQESWAYWLSLLNDPVGRVIALKMEVPCMGPSLANRKDEWLEEIARLRAAEFTCAIRLYQAEHEGKPPETLATLMPQYLAKLPDDPFAPRGTPLGYRANPDGTFVLWSRGPDRVDHGGRHDIRRYASDAAVAVSLAVIALALFFAFGSRRRGEAGGCGSVVDAALLPGRLDRLVIFSIVCPVLVDMACSESR